MTPFGSFEDKFFFLRKFWDLPDLELDILFGNKCD